MSLLVVGDGGVARCAWATSAPDYVAYHDDEWGRRVRGERELFERLTLESFQSGLSWLTILRKREAFRAAFVGFEPDAGGLFDAVADVPGEVEDVGDVFLIQVLAVVGHAAGEHVRLRDVLVACSHREGQ